jgi:hypothetical protein
MQPLDKSSASTAAKPRNDRKEYLVGVAIEREVDVGTHRFIERARRMNQRVRAAGGIECCENGT